MGKRASTLVPNPAYETYLANYNRLVRLFEEWGLRGHRLSRAMSAVVCERIIPGRGFGGVRIRPATLTKQEARRLARTVKPH